MTDSPDAGAFHSGREDASKLLFRDAEGSLYLIPAATAQPYRLPPEDAAALVDLAQRVSHALDLDDVRGFALPSGINVPAAFQKDLAATRIAEVRGGLLPNLPILIQFIGFSGAGGRAGGPL